MADYLHQIDPNHNHNHQVLPFNHQKPIIQLQKQTSQRSLYSQNQVDLSPALVKKQPQFQNIKNYSKTYNVAQTQPQNSISNHRTQTQARSLVKNRYQNYDNQENPLNAQKPQVKQFKRSSNNTLQNTTAELKHEYKNYKNQFQNQLADYSQRTHLENQTLKNLLKFYQNPRSSTKQKKYDELSKDMQNRSLRSSQGGRWLKSQSFMQQTQKKKTSMIQNLIKNYHRHESKYSMQLQKYIQVFTNLEEKLLNQPFGISLMHSLEDVKVKMEVYMQKIVQLENLPIDKPNFEWNQGELTKFFTKYEPMFLSKQSLNAVTRKLSLKKYKNCVFFGNLRNGRKQGQGIIYYFNGRIFQGKFEEDRKVYGFEIEEEQNEIYVGEFQNNLRHGKGILKNSKQLLWGDFCKGEFMVDAVSSLPLTPNYTNSDNKFNITNGTFASNEAKVLSQTKDKLRQGFKLTFDGLFVYSQSIFIIKSSTNDIYVGSFNQQTYEKHGEGLQIFQNGDLYIGNYQNNTPQHYGEYYWASGAYYRGEFMSGMRHGKGKWHMLHGDMYDGDYMNDKKNGKGTYLWKNGAKYVGAFENDYRHGYGEMTWNDGRIYKGQWINGIQKNVQIKLDKGIDKKVKNPTTTLSLPDNKKKSQSKRHFLPGVTKKSHRSSSNPQTNQQFSTMNTSYIINKKITIQNIKALYNPSNY